MRRAFWLFLLFALVLVARDAAAEDVPVPVGLQAELLAKVAAYDRNLPERAGERVRVFLVQKPGNDDSARAIVQMTGALGQIGSIGGLPHDDIVVAWGGAAALAQAVKTQRAAIVYFTPGFSGDADAIRAAFAGVDVLTVGAVPDYVPRGIVLGFDIVEGKPKLLVNLSQAAKQNVAFKAEVLKMMRVYP
ncbi:MAG TPA: YfiR family protein [Polyangiaceae bacterium]